ncbi:MAG: energy-coupling factor transporter transmembrane component T family protein [Fusobacteriaceae bacterium]
MKDNLIIGKYKEGTTFFHRLNPVTKIITALTISICSIVNSHMFFFYIMTGIFLGTVIFSGIGLKNFLFGIKPIFYIFIWTLIFQLLFTKTGDIFFQWKIITIYQGSLSNGLLILLRFFLLIGVAFILTLTTPPIELTHGLEDFFSPLKKLKLPVSELALILSIALRFIPLFFEESERIKNAQASKGWDVRELNFIEKIKFHSKILVPLISSAIIRAEELANAMEIKGYSLHNNKTRFNEYYFNKRDFLFLFFIILFFLLFLKFRYNISYSSFIPLSV